MKHNICNMNQITVNRRNFLHEIDRDTISHTKSLFKGFSSLPTRAKRQQSSDHPQKKEIKF